MVFEYIYINMKTQKVVNLLDDADNESSKFVTRKWHVINDRSNKEYGEGNENDSFMHWILSKSCIYSEA